MLKLLLQQWPCNVCQTRRQRMKIDEKTHHTWRDIPSELAHDRTKVENNGKSQEKELEASHLVD